MRLLLHAHSKIVIPPEAGFALWLYPKYSNFQFHDLNSFLDDMGGTKKINNWNLDWDELKLFLRKVKPLSYNSLINSIYLYYARSISKPVERWGDKNNFYLNYICEIKELFPNACFIHIIRDGRNVACSYKELSKKQFTSPEAPNLPNNIIEIAKEWSKNISLINNSFKQFNYENVIESRLEDLTSKPKETISKLMHFLEEDFETQMFEYYKINEKNGMEPPHYLGWKEKNTKPIQNESSEKFRTELTKEEIDYFNFYAKSNLIKYNYPL